MNLQFVKASQPIRFLLLCVFIAGCSSKKTEREQYNDITSGIKYSAYKTASKVAIVSSVEAYNYQHEDSAHLSPVYAHLLLGYFWSVSGKSAFAFAEAEIVEENSDEKGVANIKFLAKSLRSVTMYQQGWPELAMEESSKAKEHISRNPETTVAYEAAVFYMIMGTVYAKEKDFTQAKFFWAGFGTETGIHWPYQICDAAADFQAGDTQQGLKKVKIISQDPSVPQPIREAFAVQLAKIEKHAGTPVDSSLFWPKLIGALVWDELKTSSNESLKKLTSAVERARETLPY